MKRCQKTTAFWHLQISEWESLRLIYLNLTNPLYLISNRPTTRQSKVILFCPKNDHFRELLAKVSEISKIKR